MKESRSVDFLYKTVLGRTILKMMINPGFSKMMGKLLDSSLSSWFVPFYISKNNINMEMYAAPQKGYRSFNDFFKRYLKEGLLSVGKSELVSPCDGLLTVCNISEDLIFDIKHTTYSINELLKDDSLADDFRGGSALVFRLTPSHYHRYIFCCDGIVSKKIRIDGVLHSVKPVCHEEVDVFVQNSREYIVMNTSSFGKVIQMEVGALMVGKISNHDLDVDARVIKGVEKGCFEFGGSSIVVLTQKPIDIISDIINRPKKGFETDVYIGENLISG